ncbi:alpha/beta hydrolase [Halopseudomonas salegens]|uniref:alpha/beta hydrolase n=1 Tax=Halopseudomonas salegens TaxID=1434072 RepID=UPI0012FE796B|nr:alpha/beta fold hydrolase [Halopseudomonas salegens]
MTGFISALLPGYFGSLGARAFLKPRPNTSRRHWAEAFSGFERREISVDGLQVPFWVKGKGPLVLLVHGWERDHFAMGGFVAPLLDAGYRVAALDLPGHGEADGESAPLPLLARSITEIASALKQPCTVIAHSIGAAMTALATEAYGLKPDCVVLICAPRGAEDYALAQARRQGLSERALHQMVRQINQALGEPLERYRVDRALDSMTAPILLVHAADDAIVPLSDAQENLRASSAHSLWLSSGGHNRILADRLMIDNVLTWLNSPVPMPTRVVETTTAHG